MDPMALIGTQLTHAEWLFIMYAHEIEKGLNPAEIEVQHWVFRNLSKTMQDRKEIVSAMLHHSKTPMRVIREILECDLARQHSRISCYQLFRIAKREDITFEVLELLAKRKEMELDYRILGNPSITGATVHSIAGGYLGTSCVGIMRAALVHPNVLQETAESLVGFCQEFLATAKGGRYRKKYEAAILGFLQKYPGRADKDLLLSLIHDKGVPEAFVQLYIRHSDEDVRKAACDRLGIEAELSWGYRVREFFSELWWRYAY